MIKVLLGIILTPVAICALGITLAAIVGIARGFKDGMKKQ
jgi:hypothetical protein